MKIKQENIVLEKAYKFALRVVKLYKYLKTVQIGISRQAAKTQSKEEKKSRLLTVSLVSFLAILRLGVKLLILFKFNLHRLQVFDRRKAGICSEPEAAG